MSDILETILSRKREEIATLKPRAAELERAAAKQAPARGFARALAALADAGKAAVIAEIKRASPSKGLIRADFDPAFLARDYAEGGAACLSVLTDVDFFQGANAFLEQARAACALPALRKDFMLEELQIVESRGLGADCILLIAAALKPARLAALHAQASALGMDVLVEVHDRAELEDVKSAGLKGAVLLGINNRNLRTFDTRLETTLNLLPHVPAGWPVVTESGLDGAGAIRRMQSAGVQRFLIGESLMRKPSPGVALRDWLGAA